jgi:hypothetical protein
MRRAVFSRSGIAAMVAASLVGAFGGGPVIATGDKAGPPPLVQSAPNKKQIRRWRAQYVAKKLLRWRGVGMFSRGPRWPKVVPVTKVLSRVRAQDNTTYVQLESGALVCYPRKVRHTRPMRKMIRRLRQEMLTNGRFRGQTT